MNEFYRNQIERVQNSYKVTKNEQGQMIIKYEPPVEEDDSYDINKILGCLEQNRRSYSVFKAIYNYFFKKNPVKQEVPCTAVFEWLNNEKFAIGTKN